MANDFKKKLEDELGSASWNMLLPHLERDSIIVVSQDLNILAVGARVAKDDKVQIENWLNEGKIGKPTQEQLDSWNNNSEKPFLFLILQPYVFVQEKAH